MSKLPRRTFVKASLLAGAGSMLGSRTMAASDPTSGRRLVFDEQFRTIDWTIWEAGRKATTFDPGFYGRSAFARNLGEEDFNPYAIVDDAATANGKALQISAKYIGKEMSVPHYYGNSEPQQQWISGNLQTARTDGTIMRGWRTGYFETRMIFPKHPLTWPAFWLMNGRSILFPKTSIEIDIVEQKGFEPSNAGRTSRRGRRQNSGRHDDAILPIRDAGDGDRMQALFREGAGHRPGNRQADGLDDRSRGRNQGQ
jgi:hypothetical protein